MDHPLALSLIVFLAFLYAGFSSLVSSKLGNRARVKEIQDDMKKINKDHLDALKKGEKEAISKAEKAQSERLPALLKESMELQFKPLIPTLLVFFLFFYYALPQIAPDANDDAKLELFDDGLAAHCDKFANDTIYSSCFSIPKTAVNGTWIATARAVKPGGFLIFSSEDILGENSTVFSLGSSQVETNLPIMPQQNLKARVVLSTDLQSYSPGDTISLSAKVSPAPDAGVEKVHASLDSGTRFWIVSPFDIPLVGKEVHTSTLFILIVLVSGILIQIALSVQKKASSMLSKKVVS